MAKQLGRVYFSHWLKLAPDAFEVKAEPVEGEWLLTMVDRPSEKQDDGGLEPAYLLVSSSNGAVFYGRVYNLPRKDMLRAVHWYHSVKWPPFPK